MRLIFVVDWRVDSHVGEKEMPAMRSRAVLIIGLLAACLFPAVAVAQSDPVFLAGQSAQMATTMALADMISKRGRAHVHGHPPTRSQARSTTSHSALAFHVDPAARRQSVDLFVAKVRRVDPAGAEHVRQAFLTQDGFGKISAWMHRYGLSSSNLADCVTVYLSSSWLAARGSDADPSRAQIMGLRGQVAQAMLSTPAIVGAANTLRQSMADANIMQAALVDSLGGHARADPGMRPKVREAVARGVRAAYGLDILAVGYTDAGFVPA